jgi:hypothetical protein
MSIKASPRDSAIQLVDSNLQEVLTKYHAIKGSRRSLDKEEKSLKDQLASSLGRFINEYPDARAFEFGGSGVVLVESVNNHISAEKLLERGVDPEIVAFATKTTPYTRYDTYAVTSKEA